MSVTHIARGIQRPTVQARRGETVADVMVRGIAAVLEDSDRFDSSNAKLKLITTDERLSSKIAKQVRAAKRKESWQWQLTQRREWKGAQR